jgi:DNA-directed RNA polymerase specialized sigma24 family protein
MNYFKAAEQLLGSVPTLKKALTNLQKREQRLIDQGKPREPGGIDYGKPFTDSHYASDTLNELLELSECSRNVAETQRTLAEIERIIDQLPTEYKKILVLWYIEKHSKETIMQDMYIESLTTVYNLRNRAVAEFALLYYGAAAIPSI